MRHCERILKKIELKRFDFGSELTKIKYFKLYMNKNIHTFETNTNTCNNRYNVD